METKWNEGIFFLIINQLVFRLLLWVLLLYLGYQRPLANSAKEKVKKSWLQVLKLDFIPYLYRKTLGFKEASKEARL